MATKDANESLEQPAWETSPSHFAVVGQNANAPVLNGKPRPYICFDNAATTPCLQVVRTRVNEFLEWYSSIHRGAGFKSILSTGAYERARDVLADYVGADKDSNVVIFVRNTTHALNKLASRIPFSDGEVVLTSVMEHHSNLLPWRRRARVEYIDLLPDGSLDIDDLEHKLRIYQQRVKLVAITAASNVTGFVNPVHLIAEMAHRVGARIAVDAAQVAAHHRVDMKPDSASDHIDFLALSGHKMYAPFGIGALIGPRATFAAGEPDCVGGGVVDFVSLESAWWNGPPEKEEAGTPNCVGAVAMATAALALQDIGLDSIAHYEAELTGYLLENIRQVPGLRVFGSQTPMQAGERLGIVSFDMPGIPHALVAAILSCEGGIGVRTGCFCAHPYVLRLLEISPDKAEAHRRRILSGDRSQLPGLVRVSFGFYNTKAEVDHLVHMLHEIADGRYDGRYSLDKRSGAYVPDDFHPRLDAYFRLG